MLRPHLSRPTRRKVAGYAAAYVVSAASAVWLVPELEDLYYDNKGLKKKEFPPPVAFAMVAGAPVTLIGITALTGVGAVALLVDAIRDRLVG